MPELGEIVAIEITEPLPETGVVASTYKIKGSAKILERVGSPPWVYAEVRMKEWYKPEIAEEVSYERGFPNPVTGNFSIDFKPKKEGDYEVTVVATPAPLSLPVIGVSPITGESDVMKMAVGKVPPEERAFSLFRPTVLPETVEPGTEITISCPVISESTKEQEIKVKCLIYEGSILPGHGTKLDEYTSAVTPIAPGETKTFEFSRKTVAGTIDRRDVEVEVYIVGQLVKESEWDDVYYVGRPPEEEIDFALSRPSVTPAEITPGTAIAITYPVTSACTKEQTITVKCKIYEGSILPGHGRLIATKTSSPFTISPSQRYDVTVRHTAIAGTIDRRDVEVEVYIAGRLVKENEWDDVYYVTALALETLEVDITPAGSGYVTTEPPPDVGTNYFVHDSTGQFKYGTEVQVTAHPNPGYRFDHWSDEIRGGTSTNNPEWLSGPMTEHRAVKAHFMEEAPPPVKEAPQIQTLPAANILHNSATLITELTKVGFCSGIDCYIEWGKTTAYGFKSPERRLYPYPDPRAQLHVDIAGLEPGTTYHFRGVAVGRCVTPALTGYGADMTFTTKTEVVAGFTLRMINAPAAARFWLAAYVAGGTLPTMPVPIPINEVWAWTQPVPDYEGNFFLLVSEAQYGPYLRYVELIRVRFRDGKNYQFDWSLPPAEMRIEEI